MTGSLILSRVSLRRTAEAAALSKLIDPVEPGRAMTAHHRLLWGLFGDGPDRRRDFLWRQDGPRRFYVLSHRRPVPSGLLECESRAFAPDLAAGDRLAFLLRANATKSLSPRDATVRGQRVDVVMDALPPSGPERTAARLEVAARVGVEWLERQGTAAGFRWAPRPSPCATTARAASRAKALPLCGSECWIWRESWRSRNPVRSWRAWRVASAEAAPSAVA